MLQRLITPSIFLVFVLVFCVSMLGVDEAQAATINPPSSFSTSSSHKSVTIYWEEPDMPTLWWVQYYNIRYRKKDDTSWTQPPVNIARNDGTENRGKITLPDLTPSTTYEYQVLTCATALLLTNKCSGWSSTQEVTTKANQAPTTVGSIPNRTTIENFTFQINVGSFFTEPDGDALTWSVTSADTTKATVSMTKTVITVSTAAVGSVTITVTVTDPYSATATQSFTLTVKADAPEARDSIADFTLTGGLTSDLDMSSFFWHPGGRTLTYSATSSDTSKATASVSGATLTITAVAAGSATITVTATDSNSATATQSFTVTVDANSAPVTVGSIPNQTLSTSGAAATVDVSSYFSDPDGDTLTYSATSSDTSKATVSLSVSTLTITAVAAGSATITVKATDYHTLNTDGAVTQTFSVSVSSNRAPVRVGSIPTQTVSVNGSAGTVDVSSYFSDPDGNPLTYSATSSSPSKATVSMSAATLTITPVAAGWSTITVTATDTANASRTQTFSVNVISNYAPIRVGTIPNQLVRVGSSAATVDVSSYFSDPDGDTLTYSATSYSTSRATVSMSGSTLTITPVAAGTATISVKATDPHNASRTQTFSVKVVASNTLVVVGSIPTQTVTVTGTPATVDVSSYFSGTIGETLTYSATSSNTSKATVSVSGSTLSILAVAAGSSTITVTATDSNSATATQTFTVTVEPNSAPVAVGTIPAQMVSVTATSKTVDVSPYFSDPEGNTLTYSATSSDTGKATVSMSGATLTITVVAAGSTTVTITATDPVYLTVTQNVSVTVAGYPTVTTMPDITLDLADTWSNYPNIVVDTSKYFSDPSGLTLTITASSSNTSLVYTSVSGGGVKLLMSNVTTGSSTITITATNTFNLSVSGSFTFTQELFSEADATPGLSSGEQLLLGQLLTYDTFIFNELHNGTDDANDWLELRNVSNVDIPLDNWQLIIQTGSGSALISFPAGTAIAAGDVLLITNTEIATAAVVVESFVLPETDFALILRSPTAFGDLAGNYFQTQKERPETAPELTADTVWERVQATTSGYRAEAWAVSTHRNGLGSPGYQPSALPGDLNHDGVVNILDLVLVASQFGTTGPSAADINGDDTVNVQDLVLVANALNAVAAAPYVKQPTAAIVNTWLQLAQQNEIVRWVERSETRHLPKGFSYERGIQVLEQLARALTPETTALLTNYPNPFNPETWIPYQLAKPADVTVTIYASDGTVVRTLAFGHQAAGMYKNRSQAAYWDGKNELGETVASGLYFYTLTAGGFSATRKMLILK